MKIINRRSAFPAALLGLAALAGSPLAQADGMVPETSVVIVDEAVGEASIRVTNTDSTLSLLHVTLENVPEDTDPILFVTPQLSRVEAGKQQLVRFMLTSKEPLKTQRLKRVLFEGIPQSQAKQGQGHSKVGVSVAQNLPVILHPKGLPRNREPWTGLTWSAGNGVLNVSNDTPYVVRLAQNVQILPHDAQVMLPRPYLLPGDSLALPLPKEAATVASVRLYPATVYGFFVDHYDAPVASK